MIGAVRILGWLVPLSLAQGAIVAVAVWIALRALPLDRARLRHGIAIGGLAVMVAAMVATAAILLVDWNAHMACWTSESPVVTAECRAHGVPVPAGAEPAPKASATVGWTSWLRVPAVPGERAVATSWTSVAAAFGAAWLATVLLLGLREVRLRRAVRRIHAEAAPIEDPGVRAEIEDLRGGLGIAGPVDIRESRHVSTPCVIGATIVFPAGLRLALNPAEVRGVLAHEMAHVRRNDGRTLTLQRAATAVLFFNPFAAWLGRRAREEREVACDRIAAVTGTRSRVDYARALLLIEGFRAAPLGPRGVPALLEESELALRVERLVAAPRVGRSPCRLAIAALSAALLTGALLQATLAGASLGSWAVMAVDETYDHRGHRTD